MTTTEVVAPALDAAEAERLTMRIQLRLGTIADNYDAVMPMIREAIERDAATALGYKGVSDYIADRFGESLARVGMDMRGDVVKELTAAGMSTRSIAPVVGVSHMTVQRDLAVVTDVPTARPARVVGTDGKSYAPSQPAVRVDHETGEVSDAPAPQRAYAPRMDVVRVINSALTRARDAADLAEQIKRDHLTNRSDEAATWGRALAESLESLQRLQDLFTEATT